MMTSASKEEPLPSFDGKPPGIPSSCDDVEACSTAANEEDPYAKPQPERTSQFMCTPWPGALTLLSNHKHLLIAPVVLFCIIVALCSFGIVYDLNNAYDKEGEQARDAALSAADGIAKQLSSASSAALSTAAVVKINPNWSFLDSNFEALSKELFRQSEDDDDGNLKLVELAFIPFGRVSGIVGNYGDQSKVNSSRDLFNPELVQVLQPYQTIKERGLTLNGPIQVEFKEDRPLERIFAARYPVFFNDTDEDESWGHPDNITHPTGCPGPPCYNPETREKFWGFIGALVDAEPLLAGDNVYLKRLLSDNLSYSLTASFVAGTNGPGTLVSGGPIPEKVTANVSVNLPGVSWALSVHNPRQDQIVKLRDGLLALVIVAAFILSVLLLLLLLSAKSASVLLQEQLVTNKALHDEKVSREALLGRQFDLLACFEQSARPTRNLSSINNSKYSCGQLSTLDQIRETKAAIAEVANNKKEDIKVQELLAQGSFGKVYRGIWRGAYVAVKIILLPANMSGREKREKMIVWEAAISSSLIHPNICQTYTYCIKPVKENARAPVSGEGNVDSAVAFSDVNSSRHKSGIQADVNSDSSFEEVHSYEVQLVIEYCDRSSLRDALDAGLFMTLTGLNYAAQLDCAMDVAKAMLHLHSHNVLHLDLKTGNVLLATSGAEGKGVICKVSDFGLSVRMDHMETHVSSLFQGTMTHMAPEVMLSGTCSKASDVYAFGIVLWELYTGSLPFHGVPPALLGHLIVKEGRRPPWPSDVPQGYRDLVGACWDQNPDARPTFESILENLTRLRKDLGGPTPPLKPYPEQRVQSKHSIKARETFASASQPSLNLLQSKASQSSLQSKVRASPSQADELMRAWMQPRGPKGNLSARSRSTPQHAVPHEGQEEEASASQPSFCQLDPEERNSLQRKETTSTTASQAEKLMQAWMQPKGSKGTASERRRSTPNQAQPLNPGGPSQAPFKNSEGETAQEGTASALEKAASALEKASALERAASACEKEGAGKTWSSSNLAQKAGHGGMDHPQSGLFGGGTLPLSPRPGHAVPLYSEGHEKRGNEGDPLASRTEGGSVSIHVCQHTNDLMK